MNKLRLWPNRHHHEQQLQQIKNVRKINYRLLKFHFLLFFSLHIRLIKCVLFSASFTLSLCISFAINLFLLCYKSCMGTYTMTMYTRKAYNLLAIRLFIITTPHCRLRDININKNMLNLCLYKLQVIYACESVYKLFFCVNCRRFLRHFEYLHFVYYFIVFFRKNEKMKLMTVWKGMNRCQRRKI